MRLWGALWRSENLLDGKREFLLYCDGLPALFNKREEARIFIKGKYGYIKERKDLQQEPHGWKMPIPVKVRVVQI
jgi:hypothetical protein